MSLSPTLPGTGWILCDEYFKDGRAFHFSTRRLLRRQVAALADDGFGHVVGLEAEWYLSAVVQDRLSSENVGWPGRRGRPIETAPVEPGFSYHSETNLDLVQDVLDQLVGAFGQLGLNLRSVENEWGPGQLECTFAAADALTAADNYLLFRTATRQICRRLGFFATFMCRPDLAGHYPSGWHLHQSLIGTENGENAFVPDTEDALSPTGRAFLAGLLEHAVSGAVFATPTVNGYRRFRRNSLAPDRLTWSTDHRGVLMRVLGGPEDPDTRIENRAGEPAANPYLFIAAQIAAGRDGLARGLEPGPPDAEPYRADRTKLPATLGDALDALEGDAFYRSAFGDLFIDYYLRLKRAEVDRFQQFCIDNDIDDRPDVVTQWEQNEYYDFF